MSLLNDLDREKIKLAWSQGFTKASFGGGKGTCQLTGERDGSVVLFVYDTKEDFVSDFRDAATPYLFSMRAYKGLKKEMDTMFPESTAIREKLLRRPPPFGKPKAKKPMKSGDDKLT